MKRIVATAFAVLLALPSLAVAETLPQGNKFVKAVQLDAGNLCTNDTATTDQWTFKPCTAGTDTIADCTTGNLFTFTESSGNRFVGRCFSPGTSTLAYSAFKAFLDDSASYTDATVTTEAYRGVDVRGTLSIINAASGGGGASCLGVSNLISNSDIESATVDCWRSSGTLSAGSCGLVCGGSSQTYPNPDDWILTSAAASYLSSNAACHGGAGGCLRFLNVHPSSNSGTISTRRLTSSGTSSLCGGDACSGGGQGLWTGSSAYMQVNKNRTYTLTFYMKSLADQTPPDAIRPDIVFTVDISDSATEAGCVGEYECSGTDSTSGGLTAACSSWGTPSRNVTFNDVFNDDTWRQYTLTIDTNTVPAGITSDPFYLTLSIGASLTSTVTDPNTDVFLDDFAFCSPGDAVDASAVTVRALSEDQLNFTPTVTGASDTLSLGPFIGADIVPKIAPSFATGTSGSVTQTQAIGVRAGVHYTADADGTYTLTDAYSLYAETPQVGTNKYALYSCGPTDIDPACDGTPAYNFIEDTPVDKDLVTYTTAAGGVHYDSLATAGVAPSTASYITEVAESGLTNEFALATLGTGLLRNTTTTGVPVIYGGASCSPNPIVALDASGGATCGSVSGGGGATSFPTDFGTATPSSGALTIAGGTNGIDTTGSGSTVTANFDATEVEDVTWGTTSGGTWTFASGAPAPTTTWTTSQYDIYADPGNNKGYLHRNTGLFPSADDTLLLGDVASLGTSGLSNVRWKHLATKKITSGGSTLTVTTDNSDSSANTTRLELSVGNINDDAALNLSNLTTGDWDTDADGTAYAVSNAGSFSPVGNASRSLGTTSNRWGDVNATNLQSSGSTLTLKTNNGSSTNTTRLQCTAGVTTSACSITNADLTSGSGGTITASRVVGSGSSSNAVDLATAEVSGTLGHGNGGTDNTSAADDNTLVGDGTNWVTKALTDCDDASGQHVNYDTATNTWSCGTSTTSATATSFPTDSGTATPSSGSLTIAGGTNGIDTSGASATVTINFDPTEVVGAKTWSDGTTDPVWTFDGSSTGDPAMTVGSTVTATAWKFNTAASYTGASGFLFDFQNNGSTRFKQLGASGKTTLTHADAAATGTSNSPFTISTTVTSNAVGMATEGILIDQTVDVNSKTLNVVRGLRWTPVVTNTTSNTDIFGFVMVPNMGSSGTWRNLFEFDTQSPTNSGGTGTLFNNYRSQSNAGGTITDVWGFRDTPGSTNAVTRTRAGSFESVAGTWNAASSSLTDWYGLKVNEQSFGGGFGTAPNQHSISLAMDGNIFNDKYLYWGAAHTTALASRSGGVRMNGTTSFDVEIGTTVELSCTSSACDLPSNNLTLSGGKITNYNGIATVKNGVPSLLATIDSTGLTANVAAATLYSVPASGEAMYRVSAYVVETTAGSLTSTLPNVQVVYTDKDSNTSVTLDVTPILGAAGAGQSDALTANTVGTVASGTVPIYVKASTTIQYQTVNYASNLAGMTYALRIRLEAM